MSTRSDELRREIEQERERLGETAGALGYKTDVPSRAKGAVSGRSSAKRFTSSHPAIDDEPTTC